MPSPSLKHAGDVIKRGGVIAYATESCFGLGCDPRNGRAVRRLLRVKRRDVKKGLIVLAADVRQLRPYVATVPPRAAATWPGPHTWLVSARAGVPGWVRGAHSSLAVRVTAHKQAAALCLAAGMAIVSTSANRSGDRPARSYRETVRRFGKSVDYVLPGRVGRLKRPTPISDATSGKTVRAG